MRLDCFLRQMKMLADLSVDESVRDELQNLVLPRRRFLLETTRRRLERDDLGGCGALSQTPPTLCDLVEASSVVKVASQDLLALGGVHTEDIGRSPSSTHPRFGGTVMRLSR